MAAAAAAAIAAAANRKKRRGRFSRRLVGGAAASIVLLTSSAAGVSPTNTLRASVARGLDSGETFSRRSQATAGTPAPRAVPTPAPVFVPNSKCSNGYPGVESDNGKTCCMAYCLECAGVGCSGRGNSSDCCATEILQESQECEIAGEAPCFIVPPTPWAPEHTLVYFAYFFIIPFVVLAILCNYSLLPCCCEKADPNDPANTQHLRGHNTGPAPAVATPRSSAAAAAAAAAPAARKKKKPKPLPPPVGADGVSTL